MELSGVSSDSGESRFTNKLESFLHEITLSDCLSISRPLIAGAGLYLFSDQPAELSTMMAVAFITDWDLSRIGVMALWRENLAVRNTGHIWIFSEIELWSILR